MRSLASLRLASPSQAKARHGWQGMAWFGMVCLYHFGSWLPQNCRVTCVSNFLSKNSVNLHLAHCNGIVETKLATARINFEKASRVGMAWGVSACLRGFWCSSFLHTVSAPSHGRSYFSTQAHQDHARITRPQWPTADKRQLAPFSTHVRARSPQFASPTTVGPARPDEE